MYVPKKMIQNEFKELVCPTPKDLYSRIGPRQPLGNGSSDGTEYSEVVDFNSSKLQRLARASVEDYNRLRDELIRASEESNEESNKSSEES